MYLCLIYYKTVTYIYNNLKYISVCIIERKLYYMFSLKRLHWFYGTLLMMAFVLLTPFVSHASAICGVVDGVSGTTVSGWAYNSAEPNGTLEVKVVITSQATGQTAAEYTAQADGHRNDLVSKVQGTGNYGFQVSIPWDTFSDGYYRIEAYANGQKLSNTPIHGVGDCSSSLLSLGVFQTTAYCPCNSCSEGWGRHTSTGAVATAHHTIAVDPSVIPYGTKVMINGVVYTAEDRGGGVRGNHIDIFFDTHSESLNYGRRNVEVFLVQ